MVSSVAAVPSMFKMADPTPKEELQRVRVSYCVRLEETIPIPSRKRRTPITGASSTNMKSTLSKSGGAVKRKRMIPSPKQEVHRILSYPHVIRTR